MDKRGGTNMIRRLRQKFVLVNMLLVAAVLLIAFTALCVTSYHRLREESLVAMLRAADREGDKSPPKLEVGGTPPDKPYSMTPVFCVLLDREGSIIGVTGEEVDIADEVLAQAVSAALGSGETEGVLSAWQLRYLIRSTPDGMKIAFADRSHEVASMTSLVLTSLLVGLGGLAAFFVISLFLSGWVLRPVRRAWEQQRQFVADASHELKTPLTVILANTNILLAHREDTIAQQEKWVTYIQEEGERMKTLVDDLLFLAKADAARSPTLPECLDVSELVLGCLLPFESVAFEKKVTLRSRVQPAVKVMGDAGQLRQLTVILLDNACKYAGEQGTVAVSLSRTGDRAVLTVHNTGEPISREQLPHLFERFYRADESRSRDKGGYGLGLAIAQSIVQGHKGRITVESSRENGTLFTVTLPVKG